MGGFIVSLKGTTFAVLSFPPLEIRIQTLCGLKDSIFIATKAGKCIQLSLYWSKFSGATVNSILALRSAVVQSPRSALKPLTLPRRNSDPAIRPQHQMQLRPGAQMQLEFRKKINLESQRATWTVSSW